MADSVEEKVRKTVENTLERYRDNHVMLDAFWQWASNPTPRSAGFALEENYERIKDNLKLRYGAETQIEQVLDSLKSECNNWGDYSYTSVKDLLGNE